MRIFARTMFLLLASAWPGAVWAQFQQPTDEELKMTADPKAPGAAAVYLYREETTDDNLHYHSYYERIKVLTEKGKELATIRVPYEHGDFKVTDIKGRTIHSDGKVIPLTAKPSDLVDLKTKALQVNTMVFTLPDVEVGSVLEYRLQLRYEDDVVSSPHWQVQQPYFVHKAHYYFQPSRFMSQLMWSTKAGPNDKVVADASGRYTFDVVDVPAIPTEDWMPPLNSMNWKVEFYYTSATSQGNFWQDEGKHWLKEADHFANPSKTLQQAASQLVSASDTDEQKARKLYDAVMKLDNTDFTREKSKAERKAEKLKEIKDAERVWTQKGGSANDIALLYVAMARAAGLTAYPMEVVNRDRAIFDASYYSTYQLDDYIAIVMVGGKEVFLDPGQKMCPYGLLHWKHTLAGGLRGAAAGAGFALTPAMTYMQDSESREADLTVNADGSVSGSVRIVMNGEDALYWRQLSLENDDDEVKKRFNEQIRDELPDGVQADFDHFLALNDYNSNLLAMVKVSGNIGTSTGKRFFLPGLFFESHARHPFVAEDKRTTPIDVHYARRLVDSAVYQLPAGFTVESAPQSTNIPWANHAALTIESKADGATVQVVRKLVYNFTLIDSKEYSDLHGFYQKVASADQQQLVLTLSAAAKGN